MSGLARSGSGPGSAALRCRQARCSAAGRARPGLALGVRDQRPIVVIAGLIAVVRVPADSERGAGRLDIWGTALGSITLAAVILAVIQAGHAGPDTMVLLGAGVAVFAGAGFIWVEWRSADPMLPLDLFRRPAFTTANAVAGLMNFGTLGLLFLLTLYLQLVQQRSALLAGVAVLPLFLPLTWLAPVAGRASGRYGPKPVMITGLLIAAVGVGLLATWTADTRYPSLLPAMLAWGIGLGILTPAVVDAAVSAAPADKSGLASGVNNTARQAGGALGIAAYGAIAGQPSQTQTFLTGLHLTGLVTAGLFGAAAFATGALIPRHSSQSPSSGIHSQEA